MKINRRIDGTNIQIHYNKPSLIKNRSKNKLFLTTIWLQCHKIVNIKPKVNKTNLEAIFKLISRTNRTSCRIRYWPPYRTCLHVPIPLTTTFLLFPYISTSNQVRTCQKPYEALWSLMTWFKVFILRST